jgi:hypothetical protein
MMLVQSAEIGVGGDVLDIRVGAATSRFAIISRHRFHFHEQEQHNG